MEAAPPQFISRKQASFGLVCLLCMAATVAGMDFLARNNKVAAWLYHRQEIFAIQTSSQIHDTGYFIDSEDRLLTEQIPQADYSRGGVYIFGTSTAKVDFPADSAIHDYATANTSHRDSDQFMNYLINQRGFLSAGPPKTCIIYALSYHDARQDPTGFFSKLWGRHGLYQYDQASGIRDVPISAWRRTINVERTRISGFIDTLGLLVVEQMHLLANRHGEPPKKHYVDYYKKADRKYMGPDWLANMKKQVAALAGRVDDLQKRGVRVLIVLLPTGSWEANMPYKEEYFSDIKTLCRQRNLPLYDWSEMLPDEDFDDAMHPDAVGMAKVRIAFDKLAGGLSNAVEVIPGGIRR